MSDSSPNTMAPSRKGFNVTNTSYIAPGPSSIHSTNRTSSPETLVGKSDSASTTTTTTATAAATASPHISPVLVPSPSPVRSTPVPLITPRYQRKERANRVIQVSDSFPDQQTPSQALRQHTTESMTVRSGPLQYDQTVHFHTYEVYKHGKNQIHSRSVGYSSDGDLVMTREDYSESSDNNMSFVRKATVIAEPTVLNPRARRPLTDSELSSRRPLRLNRPKYKKYPGLYAPRNRRVRNRLMNDFFAHGEAKAILDQARERAEEGIDDTAPQIKPSFSSLPPAVLRAFDLKDDEQLREMERLGITTAASTTSANAGLHMRHPDSAEGRFQALNARLRSELQHALNSEFLSQQIEDLEACFVEFIKRDNESECLALRFRDGYGRLVCHGVTGFYKLISDSAFSPDGTAKLTYINFPSSKSKGTPHPLPFSPLIALLRGNKKHLPPRHILSANTTPMMTPQQEPQDALLDPMSPLDLNGGALFPGSAAKVTASVHLTNETVLVTLKGEPPLGPVPMYVPLLHINPADYQNMKDDATSAGVCVNPNGSAGSPDETGDDAFMSLTATQRKKLKKAAKLASAPPKEPTGGSHGKGQGRHRATAPKRSNSSNNNNNDASSA